jgi:large subunit ribosomal protein L25
MAKELLLKAEIREKTGSNSVKQVLKQGRIPAVIYGHKEEPIAISLEEHNFMEGLHHGLRLIDVQLGKKKQKTLIKELQYDCLGKKVLHADLMRIDVTEMLKITVPLEIKGSAAGMHDGGIIEQHSNKLEIECLATDIPKSIVVSVKNMKIGDSIHARDIQLPEGVKLVTSPEILMVSCHVVVEAKTTEQIEMELPAAPEVIGEVKEPEEGEAEEKK